MNKSTLKQIEQLFKESDLFSIKKKPLKIDSKFNFYNETILITGAAGSIGSGLVKQLVNNTYKKLILIDIAESPLYNLIKDLEFKDTTKIDFIILNITDKKSLRQLFKKYKPTLIFHAAAYKHVPLMENNPYEALKINILGTKLLAKLSVKYNAKKFIFISTDKAVNPINVMGISKCIAENYLKWLSSKAKTKFLITRFGNILGSNGSVLTLFKKQIESENAVTITSKTTSRYFINKHKACNLVLELAYNKKYKSNVFTFSMGNPIKIIDLARVFISNYNNSDEKIEVKITELRAGEKLHEEIISNNETLIPTENKDIFLVKQKSNLALKKINFAALKKITPDMQNTEIKSILHKYI